MKLNKLIEDILDNKLKIDIERLNDFYKDYLEIFKCCSEASEEFILTILFAAFGQPQ